MVAFTDDDEFDDALLNPALLPPNFYVDAVEWARAVRQAPSSQHVTIGVEREIVATVTAAVDVSYVRGKGLMLPVDLNAPEFFDYTTGGIRSGSAADRARPFGVPGAPIPPGVVPELQNAERIGAWGLPGAMELVMMRLETPESDDSDGEEPPRDWGWDPLH